MDVKLRPGTAEDAEACGRICYDAFAAIAAAHGVPCDFPSVEVATAVISSLLAHPGFWGVVAEADGQVVGSNFVQERSSIAGVGPITVAPATPNAASSQKLMAAVMERAADRRGPGGRVAPTRHQHP